MEIGKETLRQLLEWMPGDSAAYVMKNDTAQPLADSEGLRAISGFSEGEYADIVRDDPWGVVVLRDQESIRKAWHRCLRPPFKAQCTFRLRCAKGSHAWVHAQAKHIGTIAGEDVILASFHRVADQDSAQSKLLEDMDTIVYVCDVDTQELLYANRAAIRESYSKGNYEGCTCYGFMFGRDQVCPDCQLKMLTIGGQQELVRHDKTADRYFNICKKGVDWYGHTACVHYITDVTAHKRNEKIMATERENEAKAAFVNSVSHDMRTPLNGILGYTDMAIRAANAKGERTYLEKIKASGEFMLSLINDTLDLSKMSDGKLILSEEILHLPSLLERLLVPLRSTADLKGVKLKENLSDMRFQQVLFDGVKLQKVILNLLSNAIKYTPAGGQVELTMEGPRAFSDGMNCHIVVQDTGLGIEPDFLPKIFQPFSQEESARTRHISGSGLGLAIVKELVDLMKGRIEVSSEISQGTRFDLWLRLPEPNAVPPEVEKPSDFSRLAGIKVLLCEDNPINTEIMTMLLDTQDVTVVCVEDGQQGVERFANSDPGEFDLILMDSRMPVMDGFAATKAIRAMSRDDARTVPIIAASGDAYEEDVKRCLDAGMQAHISKPIEPHKLFALLVKWLPEKSLTHP